MKSSLIDILMTYPSQAKSFAFVCSTEERCCALAAQVAEYYRHKTVFICRNDYYSFDNLTVLENIFVKRAYFSFKMRREQERHCRELLDRFSLEIEPYTCVEDLAEEEKHILELLRAAMEKPEVLLLSKESTLVGHYYFDIYNELLGYFKEQGTTVILITTRWEDTVRICEKVAVTAGNSDNYTVISVEEIKNNPHKLIYALSDYQDDPPSLTQGSLLASIHSLFGYSEQIEQSKSLEDALTQFSAKACQDLNAAGCVIYIRDDAGKILRYCEQAMQRNYEMDGTRVSQLIDSTEGVFFANKNNCDFAALLPFRTGDIDSIVCYPISIAPRRIGLLQLVFRDAFLHTEEQITAIKILCTEITKMVLSIQLSNNATLIQESNHRIKNNLQTILGIIYMQKRHMRGQQQNEETVDVGTAFDSIISRIQAISKVHEYLSAYSTESSIPLKSLMDTIVQMYETPGLTIVSAVDDIEVDNNRSLYLAMILNELISNSCKHAFGDDFSQATITLSCQMCGDRIHIKLCDNGKGMDGAPRDPGSVGLSIVSRLLGQMNGEIIYATNHGTQVTLIIPTKPQANRE